MDGCRIYLVRHGTTLLNRANRYRGRRDVPLDAGGWQDAWAAAEELAGVPLAAVYSSPLRRARDTARVIADVAELSSVQDLPGLTNLDYGEWEGLTSAEAMAHRPAEFAAYQGYLDNARCPGGEALRTASERMLLSLRMIALLHSGEHVAAVSHAAMVRLAITDISGAPRRDWRVSLPNGSVTVIEADADQGLRVAEVPVPSRAGVLDARG